MQAAGADSPADLVELGRVVGAYGVRGWIKVEPYTAQSDVLLGARSWWLGQGSSPAGRASTVPPRAFKVLKSRTQGSTIVAWFEGFDDRTAAEALKGQRVWVSRSAFPAAQDDEYYWVDLIGCQVYGRDEAEASVLLGEVIQVIDNGAHAVLEIHRVSAEGEPLLDPKGRPVVSLVPFVAAHVGEVDLAARRIDTDWPADF